MSQDTMVKLAVFLLTMGSVSAATAGVDPESVVVLLFMFIALTVCCGMMHVLSRYNDIVPYTVAIFITGIIFSLFADVKLSSFNQSLNEWLNIQADLILYTFLPVLVFGEAMNLNWHHTQGAFIQSMYLAGPGVLLGAILMGVFTKLVLPDWGWNFCLTFGAILSATDPVAVVALLKDAGAAPKLTILIVGESLMNDGTAMVLFTLFFNFLQGTKYTWWEVVVFFIEAALGSPIFGCIMGFLCVMWMKNARRAMKEVDVTIQIIITICCAYLTFFFAQYSLQISGVLACCGAGLMLAWLAPAVILNHETMHNVWGFLEWMGNTLIFLIAGMIMGHRTFQHVGWWDWFVLLLFYVSLFVIRVIVITVLFPLVSTTGHRCSVKDAIFMAWAGLRGALAIALALIVETTSGTGASAAQSSRFLFYIGGIAALSIVINGTFAQAVLLKLGLIGNESSEKAMVTKAIRKRLRVKMDGYIDSMAEKQELSEDEKVELRGSLSIFTLAPEDRLTSVMGNPQDIEDGPIEIPAVYAEDSSLTADAAASGNTDGRVEHTSTSPLTQGVVESSDHGVVPRTKTGGSSGSITRETFRILSISQRGPQAGVIGDLLAYVRTVFLELCRVKYWHMIETGKIPRSSHSAKFLLYSIDVGIDDVRRPENGLRDWEVIEQHLENVELYIKALSAVVSCLPRDTRLKSLVKLLAFFLARREKRSVYILTSFIEAHEHAQKRIHSFLGADEEGNGSISAPADGPNAAASASHMEMEGADGTKLLVSTPEEIKVIQESKALVGRAKAVLALYSAETLNDIRAKQRQHMLLAQEVHLVQNMVREGLLSQKHAEEFIEEVIRDTQRIDNERRAIARAQTVRTQEMIEHVKNTSVGSMDDANASNVDFAVRPSMTNVNRPSFDSMEIPRSTTGSKFV